jgi:hypothetical protein
MALTAVYKQFLRSPTADVLAEDAAIHYVPTTTSINEASPIIKHLLAQTKLFTKKKENVLSVVEGQNSLCLEIDTTIEFNAGGGALLPGLDDNFISERTVVFPLV